MAFGIISGDKVIRVIFSCQISCYYPGSTKNKIMVAYFSKNNLTLIKPVRGELTCHVDGFETFKSF